MERMKKPYTKPKLVVHGEVTKIVRAAGSANRDMPTGPSTTAFPNA